MSLCHGAASVVRLSVCPSVCKLFAQIASSTRQMARSRPNLHSMVSRWACTQDVLKVKVEIKGHVIRALSFWHENRFFSRAIGWNAAKFAHDGPQMGFHPGRAQGQGRGQRSRDTGTFVLARKSLLLVGKRLDRDQTCTRWSPDRLSSRLCSRSRLRSMVT